MPRFLTVAPDQETIGSVLSMDENTALLNTPAGYTLVSIDPASDPGGIINPEIVKFDLSGPVPVILNPVTNLPTEDTGLSTLVLQTVEP